MSSISNSLSSSFLQSILSALQSSGVTTNSTGTSQVAQQGDSTQLSPLAQLMNTLQQLQQTDPTKYQQVTQQIATNLQTAAQTATSEGNTAAANQLTQLATDFTNASQTGQLPNIQDLAQALGGGGHHRHHHADEASSSGSGSDSSASSGTSSSASGASSSASSQLLSQLLSAIQSNGSQSDDSLNPMAIILNTLSNAGVTSTASANG